MSFYISAYLFSMPACLFSRRPGDTSSNSEISKGRKGSKEGFFIFNIVVVDVFFSALFFVFFFNRLHDFSVAERWAGEGGGVN